MFLFVQVAGEGQGRGGDNAGNAKVAISTICVYVFMCQLKIKTQLLPGQISRFFDFSISVALVSHPAKKRNQSFCEKKL